MTHKLTDSKSPCCPKFDPSFWDSKENVWQDKPFVKWSVRTFWHQPWPATIGKAMSAMWNKAVVAGAAPEMKDFIVMATDPTPWRSEFYMAVTKDVPEAENVKLSGQFLTKVFDGPYGAVPKWIKEMGKYVAARGKKTKKNYIYFTTCPKCAKIYGHNYSVAFAEVE